VAVCVARTGTIQCDAKAVVVAAVGVTVNSVAFQVCKRDSGGIHCLRKHVKMIVAEMS